MPRPVFHRPPGAYVGDVIPFAHEGQVQLYYLLEQRTDPKPGTPWARLSTRDFVTYEDHGVALTAGGVDEADFNAYTGSVVDGGNQLHLFYTGQNPRRVAADGTTPLQLVMHATSSDGPGRWQRQPDLTLAAPPEYEPGEFRDPFVYRHGDGSWRMLVAARHTDGPDRRRGLIAQFTSDDLRKWDLAEPLWDPRRYVMHECPDLFQWGDWWYLVFSEFTDRFVTTYRMGRSPQGPWLKPELDTVDGRAFYAAKTVELDGRRYFAGWIATKEGASDDGPWEWAGDLSVLEASQKPDGSLAFHLPSQLRERFTRQETVSFPRRDPAAVASPAGAGLVLDAVGRHLATVSAAPLPDQFHLTVTVDIGPDADECGLVLRTDRDGETGYVLRLEPRRGRMVFDRWPRRRTGPAQWQVSGDVPYAVELERPAPLPPGRHTLEVVVDGSICVAVLDQHVVLSARLYDHAHGHVGLFSAEGRTEFTDLAIRTDP